MEVNWMQDEIENITMSKWFPFRVAILLAILLGLTGVLNEIIPLNLFGNEFTAVPLLTLMAVLSVFFGGFWDYSTQRYRIEVEKHSE